MDVPVDLGAALTDVGVEVRRGVPLGPFTTYRVGGAADWFVEVADPSSLVALAGVVSRLAVPTLVVGRGSNLLVADAGFRGLALRLSEGFATVAIDGPTVIAGAAASLPVVARQTVAAGLRGFEWAVGVPGSVGGAVRMNAGGHGSDMAASLREVRVVDLTLGQDGVMSAADCELGYRRSSIGPSLVVVSATLELVEGGVVGGETELSEIVRWRRQHQPGGQNAGSVFTNPPGESAGRLVDLAGCKGHRVGSAVVSSKHANFIQADADGSADDVAELMAFVRRRVAEERGVELHAETVMVGFADELVAAAGATP